MSETVKEKYVGTKKRYEFFALRNESILKTQNIEQVKGELLEFFLSAGSNKALENELRKDGHPEDMIEDILDMSEEAEYPVRNGFKELEILFLTHDDDEEARQEVLTFASKFTGIHVEHRGMLFNFTYTSEKF